MTQAKDLLQDSMTPATLVYVKIFCADDVDQLMADIRAWVDSTAGIVSGLGAVSPLPNGKLTLAVAYVPAVAGENG